MFSDQFTHWAPWIGLTTLLSTFMLRLPLHIALQRRRSFGSPGYWLGGLVLGVVVVLAGALVTMGDTGALGDALSDSVQYLVIAAPTGCATGLIAWLIRRPDRDQPNPPTSSS